MPSPKKPKVYWTSGEIALICENLIKKRIYPTDKGIIRSVREAQAAVLSSNRQKTATGTENIRPVLDELKKLYKEREEKEVIQIDLPQKEEPVRITELPQIYYEEQEPKESLLAGLSALSIDDILKALAGKMIETVFQTLGGQVTQFTQNIMPTALESRLHAEFKHARPKIPERTLLPRITVVGLINQQAEDVESAFEGRIQFTFIKSQRIGGSGGHGGKGMVSVSGKADVVLLMVNFIGHDVQHATDKLTSPYAYINGSVSMLKKWLHGYLEGDESILKTLNGVKS